VSAARLRHLVPPQLTIQEHGGTSWIGVVPFRMRGVMRRPLPDLPGISAFEELNVRLYVEKDGKPGVWFLSLDANNALAVWAARALFHLPYFHADMSLQVDSDEVSYRSSRRRSAERFDATYAPHGETYRATPGSLEHWLTERYCLYAQAADGSLLRTEVHHEPWPLQAADAEIRENTLLVRHDVPAWGPPAQLCFARRLDVVVWSPVPSDRD
jgi:uncharacterized protein YqjF (DUF2071 family)